MDHTEISGPHVRIARKQLLLLLLLSWIYASIIAQIRLVFFLLEFDECLEPVIFLF